MMRQKAEKRTNHLSGQSIVSKAAAILLFGLLGSQPIAAQDYDIVYGSFKHYQNAQQRLSELQDILDESVPLTISTDSERDLYQVIADYDSDYGVVDTIRDQHAWTLRSRGIADRPFLREETDSSPSRTEETYQTQQPEQTARQTTEDTATQARYHDINYGLFTFLSNAVTFKNAVSDALDDPISVKVTYNPSRQQYQVYGNVDLTEENAGRLAQQQFRTLVTEGVIANDTFYSPRVIDNVQTEDVRTTRETVYSDSEAPRTTQSESSSSTQSTPQITIGTASGNFPTLYRVAVEVLDGSSNEQIRRYIDELAEYNNIRNPSDIPNGTTIRFPPSLASRADPSELTYTGSVTPSTSRSQSSRNPSVTVGTEPGAYPSLYRIAVDVLDARTDNQINRYINQLASHNSIRDTGRIPDNTRIAFPDSLEHLVTTDELTYAGFVRSTSPSTYSSERPPMNYTRLREGGPSRQGDSIDMIILHTTDHRANATSLNNLNYIARNNKAHYFIGENGTIYAITDPRYVAYGAGSSLWQGEDQLNYSSINIEVFARNYSSNGRLLPVSQRTPINQAQYRALAQLVNYLRAEYGVQSDRVLGHEQVAYPRGRRNDPGTRDGLFNWAAIGLPNNGRLRD